MKSLSFKVSPKCGLHCHVDVRALTAAQRTNFIKFFVQFEEVFFALAPGRKENSYCMPLNSTTIESLKGGGGWSAWSGRYHWMNGCAFSEHGTCEFLLMSGSLNPTHVVGWARFLLHVYTEVLNNPNMELTNFDADSCPSVSLSFQKMLGVLNLTSGPAFDWVTKRWQDVNQDVEKLRAERKARLKSAWSGKSVFEPVFVELGETMV